MSSGGVDRLTGLDALRGIAALFVALNHAAFLGGHDETLLTRSYLAVDFFFMLSGFVMARTYEGRMPPPLSFAWARFKRLWPLIAIGVAIGAARSLWGGGDIGVIAVQLALALCFLPIWNGHFPLNGPAWSILFEVIANFLHSLWLRRLPRIALLVLAGICALPLTLHDRMDTGQGPLIWFGLPRVLMSYCIGIYLWRAYENAPPKIPAACAYLGLPVILIGASFVSRDFEIFLVLLCFPVIILAGLSFSTRLGPWLGAFSFPLYAVHWPVQVGLIIMGWTWQAAFGLSLLAAGVCGMIGDARFRSLLRSLPRTNRLALRRAV